MQDENVVRDIIDSYKDDLSKVVQYLKGEFLSIRAGRANPHILDKVMVDYYGSMTPINQMANISVPEARMLLISVWDISQVRNVSKAISVADLGVQPSDDGKVIRLVFPMLTEEKRREIVKQIKKMCEDSKVTMRNARRDALDFFKEMKTDKEMTDDEYSSAEKEVQKILDGYIDTLDEMAGNKEKEVMEI